MSDRSLIFNAKGAQKSPRRRAPAEPVEPKHRHMRLIAPGRLKFGTEGDNQQHRHPLCPIHRQVKQLARGRVQPVHVFENHQHRLFPRQRFKLVQQGLERRSRRVVSTCLMSPW